MIVSLSIKNYAIIDSLNIDFNKGLNVLTGETGAGKSIIIGALSFALGYRSSTDIIRSGEEKVSVKILFDINIEDSKLMDVFNKNDIDITDSSLLISRELTIGGRNVCRVNDTLVSVSALKSITSHLIDIHGQHEHQKLFDPESHIQFLDAYASDEINIIKTQTSKSFYEMKQAEHNYNDLVIKREAELAKKNSYKEKFDEIMKLDLRPHEDEELEERISFLSNIEKIYESADKAYKIILGENEDIGYKLKKIADELCFLSEFNKDFIPAAKAIEDAAISVDDAALQLRDFIPTLEYDPYEIDELQLRLKKISDIKLKYGYTIEQVLEAANESREKLALLENYDDALIEAQKLYNAKKDTYISYADKLSAARKKNAKDLSEKLVKCIRDLAIKNAKLEIVFTNDNTYREDGYDKVQIMISTNAGEELKPLYKIASGGEISRVMLAIKSILADADKTDTLIFDEIDTGISGQTAQTVAEKMYNLSQTHQIICITHLTQLAAMADYHYLITKKTEAGKTYTYFNELTSADRVRALAQMLSGSALTQNALNHADEMLNTAKTYKANLA